MFNVAAACPDFGLTELLTQCGQFVANDGRNPLRLGQNVEQVVNFGHDLFVFDDDFVLFQARQALQTHLQNFLRLRVAQCIQAIAAHAELSLKSVRAVVVGVDHATVGAGTGEHLAHQLAVPAARHQFGFGHGRCGRIANDRDELVDVGQSHGQTFEHMAAFTGFAQSEHRAACHDFTPVLQENRDQVL